MDRLKARLQSPSFQLRAGLLLMFASIVLGILIYKADLQKWYWSGKSLELNDSPALVFFNRHKGCDCILKYYQMADVELLTWMENNQTGLQVILVDLDDQPGYALTYRIHFAPALLLLDADGDEILRQEGIINTEQVFDFTPFEEIFSQITR